MPDAMSHTRRDHPPKQMETPKSLLLLLAFLVIVGGIGTWASVSTAKTVGVASKADVDANRALLERVAQLEAEQTADVMDHRERNEELHADLCRLIYQVISVTPRLAAQGIEPCATEQKTPSARSTPFVQPSATP